MEANAGGYIYINNNLNLAAKICSDICRRTLSVPRSEQFSDSEARGKLWASTKTGEYPRIFPSFSWGIFTHVTRLDQSRASENIWWIIIKIICIWKDFLPLASIASYLQSNTENTNMVYYLCNCEVKGWNSVEVLYNLGVKEIMHKFLR